MAVFKCPGSMYAEPTGPVFMSSESGKEYVVRFALNTEVTMTL